MRRNKGTLFYHLSCEKAWFLSDFVKVWEWYLSEKKLLCMPFFTPTQMLRAISVQFFCFLSTSKHQKPSPSFQDACLISVTHVTMLSSDEIKPWTGLIEHRQLDGLAFQMSEVLCRSSKNPARLWQTVCLISFSSSPVLSSGRRDLDWIVWWELFSQMVCG